MDGVDVDGVAVTGGLATADGVVTRDAAVPRPSLPVDPPVDDEVDSDVSNLHAGAPTVERGATPAVERGATPAVESGGAPAGEREGQVGERDRRILAFERQWWKHAGAKEQAIRDVFGISSTRYYQVLNELLDNPAALAHDPVLVGRLRRLRATRSRSRAR